MQNISPVTPQLATRPPQPAAAAALQQEGLAALTAQVLAARGIRRRAEIAPPLASLPPPSAFNGIDAMVERLTRAVTNGEKIFVVGDYDVDGVASTAIIISCLRRMNANARWRTPERDSDGYGLSSAIVDAAFSRGARIILTADNGAGAHDAVARARELGVCVCVTDHHRPDAPSAADHVINPHLNDDGALANLCGAGVAFYLMAELRRRLNADIRMTDYLDLLTLATIADCVPMDAVNRSLVGAGLCRMRKGEMRLGVAALCKMANIKPSRLTARDVSFRLAPRINAAGRINMAHEAVKALLAGDDDMAQRQAEIMEEANKQRIALQRTALAAAHAQVNAAAAGIVVADAGWHGGVGGIIAGRLCDNYHRPVIVFCKYGDANGANWRGSARAPATHDIRQILANVDAAHPGLILKFGGHRQAAGITLSDARLQKFVAAFDEGCAAVAAPPPRSEIDASAPKHITATAVRQLSEIPWGMGFPRPLFYDSFAVTPYSAANGHAQMVLKNGDKTFQAIMFNTAPPQRGVINILYAVSFNDYTGEPQIIVEKIISSEAP